MSNLNNCRLYKDGHCQKWRKNGKCVPSNLDWFEDEFGQCEINEVCEKCSIYGNDCFLLTKKDIDALKSGKVLFSLDQYGTFIAYKKEE